MSAPIYRYVALLRAVNVGGHTIVKMEELRKLFEAFGFSDIVTYIQSGNVVFSTLDPDRHRLTQQLEEKLSTALGRPVTVFVLTKSDLQRAADNNPFEPVSRDGEQHCHLMFLSAEPDEEHRKALMALQGKEYRFHIQGKVLYYTYARESAGSRRTIDFEKVLGVSGTSRTWKVVDKLIELAN